jgi:2-C-methyl-D-erythritol 4-phosphate cytidylyltransferase
VLERAHAAAPADATDDAALVEALGIPVRLVPDSSRNLKITTPDDLALAELLAGDER